MFVLPRDPSAVVVKIAPRTRASGASSPSSRLIVHAPANTRHRVVVLDMGASLSKRRTERARVQPRARPRRDRRPPRVAAHASCALARRRASRFGRLGRLARVAIGYVRRVQLVDSPEVAAARRSNRPLVALESTLV